MRPQPRSLGAAAAVSRLLCAFAVLAALFGSLPEAPSAAADTHAGWAWGYNAEGQLGDTTTLTRRAAVPVVRLPTPVAVSGGRSHSAALAPDGTVWTWGTNYSGELGDQTSRYRGWASRVPGLTGIVAVAAGPWYTLALGADGTVWAWGNNESGVLGVPPDTVARRSTPERVPGLDGATAIAAGPGHALAVRGDGTVWGWGRNSRAQSDGSTSAQFNLPPGPISGVPPATAVAAGQEVGFALGRDGSVWGWGSSSYGLLGPSYWYPAPVRIEVPPARAVAVGGVHAMALGTDGAVWTWGMNSQGQLGTGQPCDDGCPTPSRVPGLPPVRAIAAGGLHSAVAAEDGSMWAWGANYDGELGDGQGANHPTPVRVLGISGATAVAAGSRHTLAIAARGPTPTATPTALPTPSGAVGMPWTWGTNENGQLGDGTTTAREYPVPIDGADRTSSLAAGYLHSLSLRQDGTVSGWGRNAMGQVGPGTGSTCSAGGGWSIHCERVPAQVGLDQVVQVAGGAEFSLALRADGTVWVWGHGGYGQLAGNGPETCRFTVLSEPCARSPVAVNGLDEVIAVAASGAHAAVVRADGSVWTWGVNAYGQLGRAAEARCRNATQNQLPPELPCSYIPGRVPIDRVIAVAAGDGYTLALKADGTVWGWGLSNHGQVGDPTTICFYPSFPCRPDPAPVHGIGGATTLAAGEGHNLALLADGTVLAWGDNRYGQLGDGTSVPREAPVRVEALNRVTAVAVGEWHSVALRDDGTVWTWGYGASGRLGNGETGHRAWPERVTHVQGITRIASSGGHTLAGPAVPPSIELGDTTATPTAVGGPPTATATRTPLPTPTRMSTATVTQTPALAVTRTATPTPSPTGTPTTVTSRTPSATASPTAPPAVPNTVAPATPIATSHTPTSTPIETAVAGVSASRHRILLPVAVRRTSP